MTINKSGPADSTPAGSGSHPEAPARGSFRDHWLAKTLVDSGILTAQQLKDLGDAGEASVWQGAVSRRWTTNDAIVEALAQAHRFTVANLEELDSRTATLVPELVARKHAILPLYHNDKRIWIATSDPLNLDTEQALSFLSSRSVEMQLAPPSVVEEQLDHVYRPERSIERILSGLQLAVVESVDLPAPEDLKDPVLDAPVAKLVDQIISDGVRVGASDIHAEPIDGAMVVRYRVDGILREVMRLPSAAGASLVRRVKVWARLDVSDPLHPHDGRAALRVDGQVVDLRVATAPVARRGEKVVIRILDKTNLKTRIGDIGMAPNELEVIERMLGAREGLILVTGPTGSGKTTTLYAALNQLKTGKVNIVTVEDPVEYDLDGISQIQVNVAQGLTFAATLRSVLRQDPDIVLVGEIRDQETAQTAMQAGFSGHLVLSTLHTNDAPSAVMRLRDMGLDSFKIAAVMKGVIAQRLVRRLCPACSEPVVVNTLPADARPNDDYSGPLDPRKAVGCRECGGSGYRGRLAIMEVMLVDATVADLIDKGQQAAVLGSAARQTGMRTLWESGLERVWRGLTTLEEIVRVLGERVMEDGTTLPGRPSVALVPEQVREALAAEPESVAFTTEGASRILIADDDPQMRRLVKMVLERDGYQVSEASDGLDAIDQVEKQRFDLLILDVDMPRLDGMGVLEELRARVSLSSLPVVMLTARSGDSEGQALDLGAQDYLVKPIQPKSLTARIRAVLKRARM